MSDLDLLLQWKAWEKQAYSDGTVWGVWYVAPEELMDAFLDSWHSAYPPPSAYWLT